MPGQGLKYLANRLVYDEYKRRLDARAVLEHYGAENLSEIPGRDGSTEIVHSCLLDRVEPHHRNGDQNPSAACNVDLKLYCCYSYWSGDLFHFIAKMERKDHLADILPVIGQFLDGATSTSEDILKELDSLLFHVESLSLDIPVYSPKVLEPWAYSHPYLREVRGISLQASSKLQIGYDPDANRIVFPHFWKGDLVGWQKRAIPEGYDYPPTSPNYPKYKNSTGFPKSTTLYNFDNVDVKEPVIVVESPMSVAKAVEFGFDNVVATFGAKVSKIQIDILRRFYGKIIVWFDDDPAGQAGERKILKGLQGFHDLFVVEPDAGKDLGDYTSAYEAAAKLDSAIPGWVRMAAYEQESRYGR